MLVAQIPKFFPPSRLPVRIPDPDSQEGEEFFGGFDGGR
jgi:hypothetical protein